MVSRLTMKALVGSQRPASMTADEMTNKKRHCMVVHVIAAVSKTMPVLLSPRERGRENYRS